MSAWSWGVEDSFPENNDFTNVNRVQNPSQNVVPLVQGVFRQDPNKTASSYFDNISSGNHTNPALNTPKFDAFNSSIPNNNNHGLGEVENKEVAPPDNRMSLRQALPNQPMRSDGLHSMPNIPARNDQGDHLNSFSIGYDPRTSNFPPPPPPLQNAYTNQDKNNQFIMPQPFQNDTRSHSQPSSFIGFESGPQSLEQSTNPFQSWNDNSRYQSYQNQEHLNRPSYTPQEFNNQYRNQATNQIERPPRPPSQKYNNRSDTPEKIQKPLTNEDTRLHGNFQKDPTIGIFPGFSNQASSEILKTSNFETQQQQPQNNPYSNPEPQIWNDQGKILSHEPHPAHPVNEQNLKEENNPSAALYGNQPQPVHQFSNFQAENQIQRSNYQRPPEPLQKPPESLQKPSEPFQKPSESLQKLPEPYQRPPESSQIPPQPFQRPPETFQRPPESYQRPPESSQKPPEPFQRPPDPYQSPSESLQKQPEPFQRPPDPYQRPSESLQKQPEPFERPPEPFQRPPESYQRPPETSQKPPEPFQRPLDPYQRPPELSQNPPEPFQRPPGLFQKQPEPFQRPPESYQRPPESSQKPPEPYQRPPESSQKPPDPYQRPSEPLQRTPEPLQRQQSIQNSHSNTPEPEPINESLKLFPMAASSPMQKVPENLEKPEDKNVDLAKQMKGMSLKENTESPFSLDRNQYLETGHLSAPKESTQDPYDEGEDHPPPGLDRLVTGHDHQVIPLMMENTNSVLRQTSSLSSGESGESGGSRRTGRLVQGQSMADDTDSIREVPGEADPVRSRVVLGQMTRGHTPPVQEQTTLSESLRDRGDNRNRELRRMVVGERAEPDQSQNGNVSDDYRQNKHRPKIRHRRGESSYEDDERDYSSDRDRRHDDYKRRDDRPRRRRDHRSPEFRSDEEMEDRRPYRSVRNDRRPRDYNSPDRDYPRDYYRDDHRRYDHYGRDYEEDFYRESYRENRSRPSSRTGLDYRRNNKFFPDYSMVMNTTGGFMDNKVCYEYLEKMRQTDPIGYAKWYYSYLQEKQMASLSQATTPYSQVVYERTGVHSGQSTANQRPDINTPQFHEPKVDEDSYSYPKECHIKGALDGQGRLLTTDPHYPKEGQRPTVKLYQVSAPVLDYDTEEFLDSTGPFIPEVTHRNTVLQYLKKITDKARSSSEKLLYDLIHLVVKGNGEVNGIDVAELLMNSYRSSNPEENEKRPYHAKEPKAEGEILDRFRELLQQGNKTEAIEWAIDNGAWGHAIFLASKMDDRTYNSIMVRFANNIPDNDPLQTLYQLMSGHVPQASICCADKKWSDWRPHLAMILGNPTRNPKVDRKAIIRLGDSLNAQGRIHAAHFCYISAQVEFSVYSPNAKLVLLGSSANQKFNDFATCRAIMLTSCYEYGLRLRQRDFIIPSLQLYKLLLATKLIDCGRCKIALHYCEVISEDIVKIGKCEKKLAHDVIELSSRLKMLDPAIALSGESEAEPDWLTNIKMFYNNLPENYDPGFRIYEAPSTTNVSEVGQEISTEDNKFYNEPLYIQQDMNSQPQPQLQPLLQPQYQFMPQQQHIPLMPIEEQPYQKSLNFNPPLHENGYPPEVTHVEQVENRNYWDKPPENNLNQPNLETTPPVKGPSNNFFQTSEEQLKLNDVAPSTKPNPSPEKKQANEEKSGWLGGIWDKLSMRPKNQMRLPDDNNPTIVWDENKKRWVNKDSDNDSVATVKPPPRATDLGNQMPVNNVGPMGPPMPQNTQPQQNKYKLQKGRPMKSNYIDIMAGKDSSQPPQNIPLAAVPPAPTQNFFIPPPVQNNDNAPIDFITQAPMSNDHQPETKQLSRCSSVSSLSKEVQYYMSQPPLHPRRTVGQGPAPPMMYNPSRFPS